MASYWIDVRDTAQHATRAQGGSCNEEFSSPKYEQPASRQCGAEDRVSAMDDLHFWSSVSPFYRGTRAFLTWLLKEFEIRSDSQVLNEDELVGL